MSVLAQSVASQTLTNAIESFAQPSTQRCRWDCIALGEVMLRFDPAADRIRSARSFRVFEGGGEYNVVRGLRKTFGRKTAVLTALPRNELGLLAEELIMQGGVDTQHILWRDYDGVGRNTRMGLNFTERGFGIRGAVGMSDRGYSAAAQIRPDEFDWSALFSRDVFGTDQLFGADELGVNGARWLHTGGIFAALSESTAATALVAARAARAQRLVVSFDLNYRASLWQSHADPNAAQRSNRAIAQECDLLIGDEYSISACLGVDARQFPQRHDAFDAVPATAAAELALAEYPQLKAVAFTLRGANSASRNDWAGVLVTRTGRYQSRRYEALEIFDRVGGGDAFVAGIIHSLLTENDFQRAVDVGAAHGALAMTTPGDNAIASLAEVQAVARGDDAAARR